ncbi:glycoside hydrolase family 15 protein [Halobaculum roseum]|uniref:Glycoside hydrolase family 15 protein n=1 Tax=Halobaculum roseum TaxID=2175149 RepID=A0ABD5MQG9_9EURY|nr:glycoside hydrolase family 15 protein [Halobaculum roseum]QZY04506.1 glucan 1,4-alpha-glucosidase [Halobaculum roseum]
MRLRDALDDHKRNRDHPTRFPGERRTTAGLFSGAGGRLIHVAPDGTVRDFGYPLSGRSGLADSRFALRLDDPPVELDVDDPAVRRTDDGSVVIELAEGDQSYHGSTALVETDYETPVGPLRRLDLAVETDGGDAHVTRVAFDDADRADALDASLLVGCTFAPEGRDARVGQLHHEDAVEVFHDRERDFLAGAAGLDVIGGGLPAGPDAVLASDPHERGADALGDRREEDHLGGHIVAATGFENGAATVATLLTDREETDREAALDDLDDLLAEATSVAALSDLAADGDAAVSLPAEVPRGDSAVDDLRVLSLLSAPTGMRIAGPDFDPHYVHSGGYGYTWFRDDAEISGFLLGADERFDLGLDDWHRRSARAFIDTQLPDGTWPHRVWPRNGALAPGWANARMEAGDDVEYQADQTASVVAFLARLLDRLPEDDPLADEVAAAVDDGLDGMIASLADDGRPVACQNAWEDAGGRFAHTAARFLDAFSAVAALGSARFDRAVEATDRAALLYDALDDLWVDERGTFAVRERGDGTLDDRLDSATFALADAHRAYAAIGEVDEVRRDRLVSHVDATVDGLYHDPADSEVAGLVRYEGDGWRQRGQGHEKIWTVSTAWGANAAGEVAALLADADDARSDEFARRSLELLELVGSDGPLTVPGGFLPEQFFDDGTPDSATPLGWPHAIRLATTALLDEQEALSGADCEPAPAVD